MYQAKVDAINKLEPSMQSLSDDQLRDKTKELQQRIAGGASLDDVLVEAFAVSAALSPACHQKSLLLTAYFAGYRLYSVICICMQGEGIRL